ncbi:MAG TPA: hypothetical protein VJ842_12700 [Pyrinomonadaceae bacterium]|nr:hypothetical protein [Pyrinomonadaceae bacterium]
MKLYEDYSQSPDGWNITSTLELEDDGRFHYDETWTDYTNATVGVTVEGSWRREVGAIVLRPLRVEGAVGSWVVGQERKGIERGDTLDVGGALTLRLVPPDREQEIAVRNTGMKPLTVVLEPWGTRHTVEQGERVRVVARGLGGRRQLQVVRGAEKVVVYCPGGSQITVVREQKQTKAATPNRAPDAEAAKPTAMATVAPPATARVAEREFARFEPLTPSPDLAARIRRWIDELPTEGVENWISRLCKQHDAIPLHCTQIYLWALRPDGQVLSIDHESFARRAELENDPVTAYAALAQGARTYPELGGLLTHNPAGVSQCEVCGGMGWTETQPPAHGTDSCQRCVGMGWHAPRPADFETVQ